MTSRTRSAAAAGGDGHPQHPRRASQEAPHRTSQEAPHRGSQEAPRRTSQGARPRHDDVIDAEVVARDADAGTRPAARPTAAGGGPRDDRGVDASAVPPATLPVAVARADEPPPDDPRRSDVDEWGRSERVRELARRLYDPVYRYWFRAEWEGLDRIPLTGGALLVANHAGAIPPDAPVIMHGIERELGRPVYGLADSFFRTVPVVGTLWSRSGGVPAHPDNAHRLLHDRQQLALVFPEGIKGPSKRYADRYRLRRFGRGGFVESAMRAGVPVVPIAVVGAEEAMPVLFRSNQLAHLLRLPYFPVTANMVALGPLLGAVTYFPVKLRLRVLEPVIFDVEPGLDRYSKSRVMDEAEHVRAVLQDALHDLLRERRSVVFG